MSRTAIFACFMCFVAGGCLVFLVMMCAKNRDRRVLAGWVTYLLVVLALAYKIGGVLLL